MALPGLHIETQDISWNNLVLIIEENKDRKRFIEFVSICSFVEEFS